MSRVPRVLLAGAAVLCVACGGGQVYTTTTTYVGGDAFDDAVLDAVWDGMSGLEQAQLCAEVRVAGPRAAARVVTDEAVSFSTEQVADKLADWCM